MGANEPPDATPPTDGGTAARLESHRVDGPDGRFMVDIIINEPSAADAERAEREEREGTTSAAGDAGPEPTKPRPDAADGREPAAGDAAEPDADGGGGGPDGGLAAAPLGGAWDGVYRLVAGGGASSSPDPSFRPPRPPAPVDPAHRYYVESDVVGSGGGEGGGSADGGSGAARARLPVSYVSGGRPLPGPPRRRSIRRGESRTRGRSRSRTRGGGRSRSRSGRTDGTEDSPVRRPSSRPGREARESSRRRPVMLYCHGHDDDLGTVLNRLRNLSKGLGCDVVGFDYAGYGTSHVRDEAEDVPGGLDASKHVPPPSPSKGAELVPSEEQVHTDVRAVYDHLTGRCGIDPRDLVLYGKSLGAAAVCRLVRDLVRSSALDEVGGKGDAVGASRRPPAAGLVLHSAFRDGTVLSRDGGPVAALRDAVAAAFRGGRGERERAPFPTEEYVRDIAALEGNIPTYFVHGAQDGTVPLEHGMGLYQTVADGGERSFPPFWAEDCGHSDVETKLSTAYVKRLEQFLRHCHCERVKKESRALVAAARSRPSSLVDDVDGGGGLVIELQRAFESMAGASGGRSRSRGGGRGSSSRSASSRRSTSRSRRPPGGSGAPSSSGRPSGSSGAPSSSGRPSGGPGKPSSRRRSSSRAREMDRRDSRERARRKSGTLVMRGEVRGGDGGAELVLKSARRAGKRGAAGGKVGGTSSAGAGRKAESREPGHSR